MDSEGSAISARATSLGSALGLRSTAAHVLVVASPNAQAALQATLRSAGYDALCIDEPYAALIELVEKPLVYRAVVLSLQGLYREELAIVRTLRARLSHIEIWLAHTDGRHAAMAEAVRLGAGGILSDEGLHRLDEPASVPLDVATTSTLSARAMIIGDAGPIATASPAAHSVAAAEPVEPGSVGRETRPGDAPRSPHRDPSHASSPSNLAESTDDHASAHNSAHVGSHLHDDAPPVSLAPELPDSLASGEPILSAEELSALLADPEPATAPGRVEGGAS